MKEIVKKQKPLFGWRESSDYIILDLGTMTNAVVIRNEHLSGYFLISLRSYFSFPDSFYKQRFKSKQEAINYASKYISEWISELNEQLTINN